MGGQGESRHVSYDTVRALFRDVDQTVVVCRDDGVVTFMAGAAEQLLGYEPAEVEGRNILDFLRPEMHERIIDSMARWTDRAGAPAGEVHDLLAQDGSWRAVRYDVVSGPEVAELGAFVLTLRAADDDTPGRRVLLERLLNEDRLVRLASAFLHHSIEDFDKCVDEALHELAALDWVTRVSVWTSDRTAGSSPELLHARRRAEWAARTGAPTTELPRRTRMDASPVMRRLRDLEEVHIRSVAHLPEDWDDVKLWLEAANVRSLLAVPMVVGAEFAGFIMAEVTLEEIAFDVAMISTLRSAAAIFASAFRRNQAEHELARRARTDELTGLANRWAFQERLKETLTPSAAFPVASATAGSPRATIVTDRVVVGSLNLDRFHIVNPALGREAGDRLLIDVARRLSRAAGDDIVVARNQSDEFSLLFSDVDGVAGAVRRAERLLDAIRAPFQVGSELVSLTASVGLAPVSAIDDDADPESAAAELGRRAELAMRQARQLGGGRIETDDRTIRSRVAERVRRESELRSGITNGELTVHYQPEFDLVTRTVIGAEALARWNHPVHGLLHAVDFIPIAEESGFIAELGEQVLRASCAMLAEVELAPERPFELKVNLSTRQLDATLPGLVADVLGSSGLNPTRLCFELTESALLADPEGAVVVLRELRELGVGLAIDDFGTGYSSMLYLKRLPVTLLKIDQTFVAGLPAEVHDRAIVRATVQLANSLAIDVTAEGVEREEQVAALLDLGCTRAQGFLLGRPAPADVLLSTLR